MAELTDDAAWLERWHWPESIAARRQMAEANAKYRAGVQRYREEQAAAGGGNRSLRADGNQRMSESPAQGTQDMPKTDITDSPEPAAAPLTPDEASRMSALLGKGEAILAEEHAELGELHAKASAYVESWKPDAEAAMGHMLGVLDQFWGALNNIAQTVPAAAGIVTTLRNVRATIDNLKDATVPPPAPPELPPAPVVEPVAEQKPAADSAAA